MLPFLGEIIEKHPLVVIITILIITIGFSLFIPAIEFKTDFDEFTPDDEIVKANTRIQDYFGEGQQLLFIYATNEDSSHILTTQAIRDMYRLQEQLESLPDVESSYSIVTFLDMICYVEYGLSLMECSDTQIQTALYDLLSMEEITEMSILKKDDANEKIDYKRFPLFSKGKTVDSGDIKSCRIIQNENTLTFSIEVYDLIDLSSQLKPVYPNINVMEWFVSFNNLITPIEDLNITYKIAAHIQPNQVFWELGKGVINNVKSLLHQIRTNTLFGKYKEEVYLWIKPSNQDFSFPIALTSADISFNSNANLIDISVSLDELSEYGIAPQFGAFALPAKLSDFQVGTRYYQTGLFNRAGGKIAANTSVLLDKFQTWQSKPLMSRIAGSLLQRYGNLSWIEFNEFYEMLETSSMLPETLSLKDIESNWIIADIAPDEGKQSDSSYPIIPVFYNEVRLNIRSFLSEESDEKNKPKSTLLFLELNPTKDYDEIIQINTDIAEEIQQIDDSITSIQTRVTGLGINSAEINTLTTQANQFIAPAIFIIIVAVLYINFRRISYVVLPMLALVVSTIWLFGAMSLMGIPFNVISIALVPLILGLGVDYAVHLFHNYRVELRKGMSPGKAIKNSVSEIGTAMFLAMLTTVIAFLSFLTASVPPVRDFGILLALGVTFTFITSITLLAALRLILDKRKTVVIKRKQQGLAVQKLMRKISEKILCYQKTILIIMISITTFFLLGATQIETGYDLNQFAPTDTPSFELYDIIADEFPFSSQTQNYILLEGDIATVELLEGIIQTHENIKDDQFIAKNEDGSIQINSIYSQIQQIVNNNKSLITRFRLDPDSFIPQTDSDVKDFFDYLYKVGESEMLSPDGMNDMLSDSIELSDMEISLYNGEISSVLYKQNNKYVATIIRLYLDSSFSTIEGNIKDELEILNKEITEDIVSYGNVESIATGPNLINLKITNNLTESQVLSTIVSIILAALVLILVYRNFSLGLIALIPVGISIIWILGTMYFIGYSLNVLTITVTSITIGIGIDYAIHATERFRFIVDKTGDVTKAVCETISHTGGALLIAALTTALGFIVLVFAPIPPQQQFGLILSITIVYSFLTSIFLLPLVIYRWAVRQQRKKGYVISNKTMRNSSNKSLQIDDSSCSCGEDEI